MRTLVLARTLPKDGNKQNNGVKIAALYGESVCHRGNAVEDNNLKEGSVYVDLSDDLLEGGNENFKRVSKKPKKLACHRKGQ